MILRRVEESRWSRGGRRTTSSSICISLCLSIIVSIIVGVLSSVFILYSHEKCQYQYQYFMSAIMVMVMVYALLCIGVLVCNHSLRTHSLSHSLIYLCTIIIITVSVFIIIQ